ncbi:hypothetical protein ACFY8P_19780 [Streptomyces sp. NPDC012693]|uniref:hypothetical protein n=1 Tax=unclassified Streptomyces TaxID=2593676 RepID=UPI00202E11E2|nr:hypothetical protein [Streptomyces sp. MSC1_001]
MPRSTRRLPHAFVRAAAVFALSAGVTVPVVIHAPAAHADWTSITGTTEDDGRYTVTLPSSALWVKVSVMSSAAADATVLASTEELTPSGSWLSTKSPVVLPEGTALGDYPVRVDYRLPGETTKRWTAGTYGHKPHIGVGKLSYDRAATTWDDRRAVLTGTTTLWNPATGERTTAPEGTKVQVDLPIENNSSWRTVTAVATVGADGTFTLPVTPNGSIQHGSAKVVETAPGLDPDNAVVTPHLPASATLRYRISSNVSKYRVLASTDVRVTGRVERLTPDGWKPFAGVPVVATGLEPRYGESTAVNVLGGVNSAADGTFSFNARPYYVTDAVYTSLRPSPYFATDPRPYDKNDIVVPQPLSYNPYRITLDAYGKVTATGKVSAGYCDKAQPVVLQYSRDGGRTWGTLRSGSTDYYCQYNLSAWGYSDARYRVHHPETDEFVAKSGAVIRLARYETRFSAFTITPTRPVVNGKMTVSGTVQRKVNGVWKPFPGAKLALYLKPKGDTQWYWVTKSITTNTYGNFSYRATAYEDASWIVVLQPPAGYFFSESAVKYVDAR